MLKQAGLSDASPIEIISVCRGLTATDAYWVVPEGFDGTWAECNLFDNELDVALQLAAFAGVMSFQKHGLGLTPELTTNGSYPKAWRQIGGELYLFKAARHPFFNGANEDCGPYSEYFAAQAAEAA
ncbi:MAG: hypothetical protein ACI361_05130 [Atopobiaceae bacterium]